MNVEEVFLRAQEKKTLAERTAFLDGACGEDGELRARVDALLNSQEQAGSFLEQPLFENESTHASAISEQPGVRIGPYKLLQQIGEGGFGVVFMAEQLEPIQRKVALKIIKPGMDTKEVIARFEAERQALAMMEHPNIAQVFDAGSTESGRPFFVMELVRGIAITDYCDQANLTPRERLDLFVSVCLAVQHAHQKGIIHRDIKAGNVLVTLHDGEPVTKVIDFGIAKATGYRLTDRTLFTQFGQMVGTPTYMSPEQAALSGIEVDVRTDIYALGALLYELLTGATPFGTERLRKVPFDEIRRIIREEDPPMPSQKISTLGEALNAVSANRQTEPKRLSTLVSGDLDWIVMKALEKDRSRRYETAVELAADVERFLKDEPVAARPPSILYRLEKFTRRNRSLVATTAGILGTAILAIVITAAVMPYIMPNPKPIPVNAKAAARIAIAEKEHQATAAARQQDYATAESLFREVLQRKQVEFGPDDPDTYTTMIHLAETVSQQKRLDEASTLANEAFAGHRRLLGKDNMDFWESRSLFFRIHSAACGELIGEFDGPPGNLARARVLARRFAAADVNAFKTPQILANIEYCHGDPRTGIDIAKAGLRGGHPRAWIWGTLAGCYAQVGEQESARDWFSAYCEAVGATSELGSKWSDHPFVGHRVYRHFASMLKLPAPPPPVEKEPASYVQIYDRLIDQFPETDTLFWRRGTCHARLGEWKKAEADFESAFRLVPEDCWYQFVWALACLQTGNTQGYNEACSAALSVFDSAVTPHQVAEAATIDSLAAGTDVDRQKVLELADWVVQYSSYGNDFRVAGLVAKGMVLYRCGRFAEAIRCFEANTMSKTVRDRGLSQAFLAMSHHRLGNTTKARSCLAESRRILEHGVPAVKGYAPYALERPLLEVMLKTPIGEAESLIESGGVRLLPEVSLGR